MPDLHKNFAYSLVATAPSPATSGTSLIVTAGQGSLFPTPPFNATIWPTGSNPLSTNAEIVRVTAISTDTLTITRQQESTSARTVIVGDQIAATITAKTLQDVDLYIEVTGISQAMSPNVSYGANNGSLVTLTLPATANCIVGDRLRVVGIGAGGWKIAQNASQTIRVGDVSTLAGTSGYIASTQQRDSVDLIYVASNEWEVVNIVGNITVNIS